MLQRLPHRQSLRGIAMIEVGAKVVVHVDDCEGRKSIMSAGGSGPTASGDGLGSMDAVIVEALRVDRDNDRTAFRVYNRQPQPYHGLLREKPR